MGIPTAILGQKSRLAERLFPQNSTAGFPHGSPTRGDRSMRLATVIACTLWITMLAVVPGYAEKRVALVIGNGTYERADRLANPVTDARRMRDTLSKLGFEVVYGGTSTKQSLERAIGRFANTVQDAEVALVYFAGHGATFGDIPYVVPVDAQFSSLGEVPYELVPVETLIGELRRAKGLRIAILDACRDDTAERELKRAAARGGEITRGLARVRNPEGLILAYATQYLSTAADNGPNGDSPFTAALLNNIATPGLDVKEMFFKVGSEVEVTTQGRQRPEISVSFYEFLRLGSVGCGSAARTLQRCEHGCGRPGKRRRSIQSRGLAREGQCLSGEGRARGRTSLQARRRPAIRPRAVRSRSLLLVWPRGGLPNDDREAARLYKLAADQGDAAGQSALGAFYSYGRGGLPNDDREAARLFQLAAVQGNVGAQNYLGVFYRDGRGGLPKNDRMAALLFRVAADQGNDGAQNNLGVFYRDGRGGLQKDDSEAARLFRLSANQGNDGGQVNLAIFYEHGLGGLLVDKAQAVRLYTLAADQGNITARAALHRLN